MPCIERGRRLPDFIGIGPAHAGTTWLHWVLKVRVGLPLPKKRLTFSISITQRALTGTPNASLIAPAHRRSRRSAPISRRIRHARESRAIYRTASLSANCATPPNGPTRRINLRSTTNSRMTASNERWRPLPTSRTEISTPVLWPNGTQPSAGSGSSFYCSRIYATGPRLTSTGCANSSACRESIWRRWSCPSERSMRIRLSPAVHRWPERDAERSIGCAIASLIARLPCWTGSGCGSCALTASSLE